MEEELRTRSVPFLAQQATASPISLNPSLARARIPFRKVEGAGMAAILSHKRALATAQNPINNH